MTSDRKVDLTLIVPGDPDQRTGGYLYDARVVQALRRSGWAVRVVGLDGRFPETDQRFREHFLAVLAALPDGARVLIDGLALGGAPEVAEAHAERLRLCALVHHPLADETGLPEALRQRFLSSERRALAACRRIIVTSSFCARRLGELGLSTIEPRVAEPGVAPAALAKAARQGLEGRTATGEALLCVASVTPRKGQDVLIEALAGIGDRGWRLELAGSTRRDPAYAARVEHMIGRHGLADRVRALGELDQNALDAAFERADVVIVPSHYEGYGMVVTEALARGLPLIATDGGALADTVPAGCSLRVPGGHPAALRDALIRWLDDEALRSSLYHAALQQRDRLPTWSETARCVAAAVSSEPAASLKP